MQTPGAGYVPAGFHDVTFCTEYEAAGERFEQSAPRRLSSTSLPSSTESQPDKMSRTWPTLRSLAHTTTTNASRRHQAVEVVSETLNVTVYDEYVAFEPVGAIPHAVEGAVFEITGNVQIVFAKSAQETFNGTAGLIPWPYYSNNLMQGIWNGSTDADAWIANVALSMTNAIRTTSGIDWPRPQYDGTSYELGVHIRWAWLILPVVLILTSILLLVAVMVRTAKSPVAAWKGSPLSLLLFDVDQELKDASFGHECEYRGMHKAVGDSRVGLRKQEGGLWKFERR